MLKRSKHSGKPDAKGISDDGYHLFIRVQLFSLLRNTSNVWYFESGLIKGFAQKR